MKKIATGSAMLGIVSGFLLALAPWVFGTPGPSATLWIAPLIVGALLSITHRFTLKRLNKSDPKSWPIGLLAANISLLAFFVVGTLYAISRLGGSPNFSLIIGAFILLWPVPLAVNLISLIAFARPR